MKSILQINAGQGVKNRESSYTVAEWRSPWAAIVTTELGQIVLAEALGSQLGVNVCLVIIGNS